MNNLQIFVYSQNEVRTILKDGEPWFVAKDVCDYFGVTNQYRTLKKVEGEDKGVYPLQTSGGKQDLIIINEFGLYNLLFSIQPQKKASMTQEEYDYKVTNLKNFKRWVTHEVIPQIRKTGQYSLGIKADSYIIENPIERAKRWIEEQEEKKLLVQKIQNDKPLVTFAETALKSKDNILVRELAKIMCDQGINIGEKRLYKWLRNQKLVMKRL